jgi:hypothetical protein
MESSGEVVFLECVHVTLLGDAIDAEIGEFAFVEDED